MLKILRCGRSCLVMLLCLGACAEYPWVSEEDHAVIVPMDLSSNMPLIKAVVDGFGPYWFVVDTGAPITVLNQWFVEKWANEHRRARPSKVIRLQSIRIHDVTVVDEVAYLANLGPLERSVGLPIAGRLGMSVFQEFLITLDYPNGWFVMSEGSLPEADGLEVFDSVAILEPKITVRLDGREVFAKIDSSRPHAVSIDKRFQERALSMMLYSGESVWLRGELKEKQIGRCPVSLMIGRYDLDRPYLVVAKSGGISLGHGLLRDFVVRIDGPNSRVALHRDGGNQVPAVPIYSVGCVFLRDGREWRVVDVMPDTVAVRLGMIAGDRVMLINGMPAYKVSPRAWQQMLEKKQRIRFQVKKGNRVVEKVLPVYRMVPEGG